MKQIIFALAFLLVSGIAGAQTGESTGTADTGSPIFGGSGDNATGAAEQPMAGEQQPGVVGGVEMPFEAMDMDADQNVTFEEFQEAFPEVDRGMFEDFDLDGSGSLNAQEWEDARRHLELRGHELEQSPLQGQPMQETPMDQEREMPFGVMDMDADQNVTWEEFQEAFPEVDRGMFEDFDLDGSGSLNAQEWEDAQRHLELRGHELEQSPFQGQPMQDQGAGTTGRQTY
jgi:hypothetical protein